jgi:hypothetical protein
LVVLSSEGAPETGAAREVTGEVKHLQALGRTVMVLLVEKPIEPPAATTEGTGPEPGQAPEDQAKAPETDPREPTEVPDIPPK